MMRLIKDRVSEKLMASTEKPQFMQTKHSIEENFLSVFNCYCLPFPQIILSLDFFFSYVRPKELPFPFFCN